MTRLMEVSQGKTVRIVGFNAGGGLTAKLSQYGIYPGDCVRVLRKAPLKGPLLVECNQREIALGRGVAEKIIVEIEPCA